MTHFPPATIRTVVHSIPAHELDGTDLFQEIDRHLAFKAEPYETRYAVTYQHPARFTMRPPTGEELRTDRRTVEATLTLNR